MLSGTGIERVVVTPRWGGTPADDWYPWLGEQLGEPPVVRLPLPDLDAPKIDRCVSVFGGALAEGEPSRTLCVGHSVSVQGWLRTFAANPDTRVLGLVAVAGWWSVDEPWPAIRPWIETPHDLAAIRRACPRVHVLLGTGDRFTADQARNAEIWRERLGATVTVVEGAAHFNGGEAPEVLAAVRAGLG